MKLKYTFRSLIELEKETGRKLGELLGDESLETFALIVAAGLNTNLDNACEVIQSEIEDGKTFEDIAANVVTSLENSGLLGKRMKKAKP